MKELSNKLDSLIRTDRSFAAFRLPGSDSVRFMFMEEGEPDTLPNMQALSGRRGFVIAPFAAAPNSPVVLIDPTEDRMMALPSDAPAGDPPRIGAPAQKIDQRYSGRFEVFMAAVREGRFSKLVLSRRRFYGCDDSFSPSEAFFEACRRYKGGMCVYIFNTPVTGCWMCCTPELLLSGEKGLWQTAAMAGTQPLQPDGSLPEEWDSKNIAEQEIVARYMRSQLSSLDAFARKEEGPYVVNAGHLAHLRTDFSFELPGAGRLGEVLAYLHPTPAVSGLPKEEAIRFILLNEGYKRRYYSGFAGWLDPEGRSDIYVNLRCMNILRHSLAVYGGGGLLPSSVLEAEWKETEDKMQTILSVKPGNANASSVLE
ncbi:MAG: chorismate-binding protein [Tannerellaceae bacterium]|jgi:isochorismate synthase|nr:chorismate-binding protein [Tannerellaceae bacterium]